MTIGVYQAELAPSYIQDKSYRDRSILFQYDNNFEEDDFLRIRMYSRFINATKHNVHH